MTQPDKRPSKLLALACDIKLSHSVFALPFAILAAYLAAASQGKLLHHDGVSLLLILVCMFLARTLAMTINRLADHKIDQHKPRTKGRAIPSGRLSFTYVLTVTIVCAVAFIASTSGFYFFRDNYWPLLLSPLVLILLSAYSFMKRFTALCHIFLGSALAISPLAAGIAIAPEYLNQPDLWYLAGMVLFWVAGFDVIYALQDEEPDAEHGIHSIPSTVGTQKALWISRILHLLCVTCLYLFWQSSSHLNMIFSIGVAIVILLLVIEHMLVRDPDTGKINMAFFTLNGIISILLGTLGIIDIVRSV
ncbi:MAG: 4-hydroxybenzoate octaprenyltransferase [Phycisphaeraceae bacterium]|nr:4-hydroxybenzoate octaprenyltransferase [Phycisphaeraceae bacterium]